MNLETLTIEDMAKMPEFAKAIWDIIAAIDNTRNMPIYNEGRPKRTAYDSLADKGLLSYELLPGLYMQAIQKKLLGFSSRERTFILQLGDIALQKVYKSLKQKSDDDKKSEELSKDSN